MIEGDLNATQDQVNQALAENIPPETILKDGLIAAMTEVGRMFENGEFYVPEMLISARAMKGGLAILRPLLASANIKAIGKVIIGTVQGDLHDIGKNLVGMMLEGAGFEVIDLGVDVSPEKYVAAVKEHHPDLVVLFGPADDHHAAHEGYRAGLAGSRPAGYGQGDDRRRAGDGAICQGYRRGYLCSGCRLGCPARQAIDARMRPSLFLICSWKM